MKKIYSIFRALAPVVAVLTILSLFVLYFFHIDVPLWLSCLAMGSLAFWFATPERRTVATITALAAAALTFTGCAFNRQYATTTSTSTNGVTTVTVARSTTIAAGDAKSVIDKTRASAGKTSSVGASGIAEEATMGNVATNARALVDLINALKGP